MVLKLLSFTFFVVMMAVQSASGYGVNVRKFISVLGFIWGKLEKKNYFSNAYQWLANRNNILSNLIFSTIISIFLLMAPLSTVQATEESDHITCNTNTGAFCPTYARWFVGGQLGYSYSDVSENALTQGFESAGSTVTSLSVDDSDMAYELFAGYQFNPTWSIQLGYLDLGSRGIEFEGETPDADTFLDVVEHIYPDSGKGVKLSAIGSFPINARWQVSGRFSLFNWSQAYNTNSVSGSGDDEISGTDILLGAEVSYDIRRDVQLYLSYDRFGAEHHDADNIGLGIRYFFGANKKLPKPRVNVQAKTTAVDHYPAHVHAPSTVYTPGSLYTPTSLYAAGDVPTKSKVIPQLALPASISIYYPTGQFSFDDNNLHKLVKIKTILAVRDDLDISIHGYASTIGDKQANQRLSIRRAHGVEEQLYLRGVMSSRMEVNFHGDSNQLPTVEGQRVDINFIHNGDYENSEVSNTKVKRGIVLEPEIEPSIIEKELQAAEAQALIQKHQKEQVDVKLSLGTIGSFSDDKSRVSSTTTVTKQNNKAPDIVPVVAETVQPRAEMVIPEVTIKTKAVLPDDISIYYQFGQFILDEANLLAVAEVERVLEAREDLDVSIHGYASAIGNEQHNRKLSLWRAQGVQKQLNTGGITLSRMKVGFHGGMGQSASSEGQRVEVKFQWNTENETKGIATKEVTTVLARDDMTVTNLTEELITDKPVLASKGTVYEDALLSIPAAVVKVKPKAVVPDSISIYYATDQFTLDGNNLKKLALIKNILDERDDLEISIHGYASAIGSEELNRQLSIWRAHGVQNQLYLDNIMLSRMHIEFHGDKDQPASTKGQRVDIKFNRNDNHESSENHVEEIKFDIFSERINEADIAQVQTAIDSQDLAKLHHVELISIARLPGNKQGLIELAVKRANNLADLLKYRGIKVPMLVNYVLIDPKEKKSERKVVIKFFNKI